MALDKDSTVEDAEDQLKDNLGGLAKRSAAAAEKCKEAAWWLKVFSPASASKGANSLSFPPDRLDEIIATAEKVLTATRDRGRFVRAGTAHRPHRVRGGLYAR